jgi:hypothetical protein
MVARLLEFVQPLPLVLQIALRVFADVHSVLVNLGWWMFSHRVQHATQIDEFLSIQM